MAELLFELGTEELPARFVAPAIDDMVRVFEERCRAMSIEFKSIRRFGTPRRLAIIAGEVIEKTPDVVKEVQGPSVRAAFDEQGAPRVAATKFAESVGTTIDRLKRVKTPKGEYLCATVDEKGRRTIDLMPEVLGACIRGINFSKSMRWGDVDQVFGRPLHWIVALFGTEVIPVIFSDVRSGRSTRGHRFLAPAEIELSCAADYEARLTKAHVIADIEKRRAMLVDRISACALASGGTLIDDEALIDQVVNLVELPCPVLGTFEARHLDLPQEVLVSEMKGHQRYFSLRDVAGRLLPKFIAVSNTPVRDEKLSIRGYERVLKARLTDGRFFFDEDRRTPLLDRVPMLHRIVWHRDVNSTWAEKVDRFRALAVWLAHRSGRAGDQSTIERAATLAKADLVTGMVGEFPELQGVMGREYALHGREPVEVANAIFEHYLPRSSTDALPQGHAGALIGLADRLDSICGLFAVGRKPTGAADPYGLRRAAIAVIHVISAKGYRFSLSSAVNESLLLLESKISHVKRKPGEPPVREQILEFFRGRLESLWREKHRADVVDAVLAAGFDDLVAARRRLDALSEEVLGPDFSSLAATFKRVANIVEKQGKDVQAGPVDASKLVDPAELALNEGVDKVRDAVLSQVAADDFSGAMATVRSLKPAVDGFFEHVMVMADDRTLRENRLRLLMSIGGLFGSIADFGRIQADT